MKRWLSLNYNDRKVTTFTETLENEFRRELKEAKKVMNEKIADLRDEVIRLKTTYEDESNGIFYQINSHENTDYTSLKETINSIQTRIDEIRELKESEKEKRTIEHTGDTNIATQVINIEDKSISHIDADLDNMDKTLKPSMDGTSNQLYASTNIQTQSLGNIPIVPPPPCITMDHPIPKPTNKPNSLVSQPPPPPKPLMSVFIQEDPSTHPENVRRQQEMHNCSTNTDSRQSTKNDNTMTNEPRMDNDTELLIVIDSNGTHLDHRKFWTLDRTKWVRCGNINEAARAINNTKYTQLKHVLVSVGVNDIDDDSGVDVASRISELVNMTHHLYPDVKVTLNEITPRNDNLDEQVIECNKGLLNLDKENQHVFLAKQSNLRDETYSFFHDDKHVKRNKIGRYASNLKTALRKAYGIEHPRRTNYGGFASQLYNHNARPTYWNNNRQNSRSGHYSQNQMFAQPSSNNFFRQQTNHPQSPNELRRKDMEANWKMEFKKKLIAMFD